MDNTTTSGPRLNRLVLAACVAIVSTLAVGTSAFAQAPVDPTGTAMDSVSDSIVSWVTTYGIPAVVASITLGIGLTLLVKFVRKAKSAV